MSNYPLAHIIAMSGPPPSSTVGVDLAMTWNVGGSVDVNLGLVWNTYGTASYACPLPPTKPRGSHTGITPLADSGSFLFQDSYGQLYQNTWNWTYGRTILDLTVMTEQPYVWGQPAKGIFRGKDLYRLGIITIHRTVIQPQTDGYTLLAEGYSQYIDYVRASYHCSPLPVDPFLYHLDQGSTDLTEAVVDYGPRFADPENQDDSVAVWAAVAQDGTITPTTDTMAWIDVWSN